MVSRHPLTNHAPPRSRASRRGFTLVELLAVLAMVGILAVLAMVGYRRYIMASRTGDARAVLAAIRVAEENYRAETLSYLSCSTTLSDYYPATPDGIKRHWINPSHAGAACWRMLNVVTDTPTRYGFAVMAGGPGAAMPAPDTASDPTWPNPTTEPWYVVQASGDNDQDGNPSYFVTSSVNGEVYEENPDE